MTNIWEFFGEGYKLPEVSTWKYSRIEKDKTLRIRILSKPLIGWEYFNTEKKPVRSKTRPVKLENPSISTYTWKEAPAQEFWALKVYNVDSKQIEVFSINKKTIKEMMMNLYLDDDYWSFLNYDLKISKTWEGTETKYSVLPWKVEPLSKEVLELAEKTPVNLEALYLGDDPFKVDNINIEDIPF